MLPIIDPGWLTSPTDQTVAIELYRKLRRIFNTTAFTEVRVNDEEYFPGTYSTLSPHVAQCLLLTVLATGYEYDSDAQILSVIQNSVMTVWHAACTCAMQPRANNGVLDPYLKV